MPSAGLKRQRLRQTKRRQTNWLGGLAWPHALVLQLLLARASVWVWVWVWVWLGSGHGWVGEGLGAGCEVRRGEVRCSVSQASNGRKRGQTQSHA